MYFDRNNITLQHINDDMLEEKNISLSIARFDLLHPIVSGNKFYKLYYFMKEAEKLHSKKIQTYGGAYSNHLAATAFAAKAAGMASIGIVRGEAPPVLSATLNECLANNMQLEFITRQAYKNSCLHYESNNDKVSVPEGGYHPLGAKGASLMYEDASLNNATHICLAAGTATTVAGILQKSAMDQQVIAVPVLKGMNDLEKRIYFLNNYSGYNNFHSWNDYHFGGYAKTSETLIQFMNDIYLKYQLPTDLVYTSKLMFAVLDKIKNNFFPVKSRIVCIHTGGLQGNRSLPIGSLIF